MIWLTAAVLVGAGLSGLLVVVSRDPRRQVFALAAHGLMLGVLFFVLQAPDVAFSQIAVGTVATPLLFLVALSAVAFNRTRR